MKAGVAHPAVYTHPMVGTFPHVGLSISISKVNYCIVGRCSKRVSRNRCCHDETFISE